MMSAIPGVTWRVHGVHLVARAAEDVAAFLPAWLMAGAGLAAAVDAIALHLGLLAPLPSLLPIEPDLSGRLVAAAVATGLFGLAIGLARSKRVAWWLAVAILSAALIDQIELLRQVIPVLLTVVCLVLLILTRRRYNVETGARSRRLAIVLWGGGALLAIAALGLAVGTALGLVSPATDARDLGTGLLDWLAFGDPGLTVDPYLRGGLLVFTFAVARVAVVVGVILALAPGDAPKPSVEAEKLASSVAKRYGRGALLPFQVGGDAARFTVPGLDAFVAFGLDGRVALILGDPVGPPEQDRRALVEFTAVCARNDWLAAAYQASEAGLDPLRELGYLSYHIGREAILELDGFDLSGSRRANLRHTVTRARRGGISIEWLPDGLGPHRSGLREELLELDRAWQSHAGPRLRFTVSSLQSLDQAASPIALARDAAGRLVAFTSFQPTGQDNGWVLDLLRRMPGSIPGAVEACIVEAALGLRSRGASTLSLGLAPLAGLEMGSGSPVERILGLGVRLIRSSYDVAGLAFFKGKFDPRWEPRYLVVARRAHLPAVILALLRLHFGGARGLISAGWHHRPR
jgi:phosphatidylglycerol lysyltransferase